MVTKNQYSLKRLFYPKDTHLILPLIKQLDKKKSDTYLKFALKNMFQFKNYQCIGFYADNKLVGLTSGWTTFKIYSGKQLEVDNVIIDANTQSKGYGSIFFSMIETWAKKNEYESIELNTYVANSRSHKFYFKENYKILGYHFQKKIN